MSEAFYVTMVRGKRVAWLAGPFDCKLMAECHVRAAMDEAIEVDPWAHFDAFGVTKVSGPNRPLPAGVLNERLGI